ncbi:MAG: hypothetical protein JO269_03095 [Burkholderiaceae bacterium]|nr:hypothetical protein [Burkholderiaceae bacterium]
MKRLIITFVAVTLTGCASYKQTLTNAQGQSITCEASGHAGIVTGQYLKEGFDKCVSEAENKGYKPADTVAK